MYNIDETRFFLMPIKKIIGLIAIGFVAVIAAVGSFALYDNAHTFEVTDVQEAVFTFDRYDTDDDDKLIYINEFDKPLYISSFVHPKGSVINSLNPNDTLRVGYIQVFYDDYDMEAVYIYHNDVAILTLDDYIEDQQNNLYLGSLVTGIMALLMIIVWFAYLYKKPMPSMADLIKEYEDEHGEIPAPIYVEPVPGIDTIDVNLLKGIRQYKDIAKTIPERTIQFYYLKEDANHESAIVFYRIGKQLVADYVFYENDHYLFEIFDDVLEYSYPRVSPLKSDDYEDFKSALLSFSMEKDIPIVIEIVRDEE